MIILHKTLDLIHKASKPEYIRKTFDINKAENLPPIGIQSNDAQSILWEDGVNTHVFYKIEYLAFGGLLYEYKFKEKNYIRYEISFHSEFGENCGMIIHPNFIHAVKDDKNDVLSNLCFFMWYTDEKSISIKLIPTKNVESAEWTKPFRDLKLTQSDCFAKSLQKDDYKNKFPGTEFLFFPSIHSVTYDNSVIVNDIKMNDQGEFERDTDTTYTIDSKWFDDKRINIDDPIGIMILNYKDKPERWKKYFWEPFKDSFFPIVDGKIIFPDDDEEEDSESKSCDN